jgi:hypothetical protein
MVCTMDSGTVDGKLPSEVNGDQDQGFGSVEY